MRAVIFDLWDTLVEWPPGEAVRLRERLAPIVGVADEEFNRRWAEMFRASQTGPLDEAFRVLGVPGDQIEAQVAERHEFAQRVLRPRPGTTGVLAELRGRGVKLAWVTNFTTQRQFLKLQALGLADAADFLFTSEEAGADKPDPAILKLALRRLKLSADEVWMLGDSLYDDFQMASAGGVRFVWFNRDDATMPVPRPGAMVREWAQVKAMFG